MTADNVITDPASMPAKANRLPAPMTHALLIEDNPEQMVLIQTSLQEFGQGWYRLDWASRLIDAIEHLGKARIPGEGRIDVVLLDLGLPECNGYDSYLAVRKKVPDLPVVVLTGDCREKTVHMVIRGGADGYLVKEEASGLRLIEAIQDAILHRTGRSANPSSLTFEGGSWRWKQTSPAWTTA
jgi:two-component system sensor histidine kinase UhpB